MRKNILFFIIGVLIIIIGIESFLLINQKAEEDRLLAEKVIIQTYKELHKAGDKYAGEPVGHMVANMKVVSESYTGNDKDIEIMLFEVQDYLNYKMYSIGLMPNYEGDIEGNLRKLYAYDKANDFVDTCISKYALFDKIGLYD